jgi:hypothetical protein
MPSSAFSKFAGVAIPATAKKPIKKQVHDLFMIENPLCNESIRDFLSGSWRKAAQKSVD